MQIPRPGDTKFEVLSAINLYCASNTQGPTVDELREQLGLGSKSAVQFHIDDLVEMGLLARLPRKARGLRPTAKGEKLIQLLGDLHGAVNS